MSATRRATQQNPQKLADRLVELVALLRRDGPARDWRWWGGESPRSVFKPPHPYQDGLQIFDTLVEGVRRQNAEMLSKEEVQRRLAYEFLEPQTATLYESEHLDGEALTSAARKIVEELKEFEAWHHAELPIANLRLEGEPVQLGKVTFASNPEAELVKWKHRFSHLWSEGLGKIQVVARVEAPGDLHNYSTYALAEVSRVLNVLRAFSFPFGHRSDSWQVGVLGDILTTSAATPMRINDRESISVGRRAGPANIELRAHILSELEQRQWEALGTLMQKRQQTEMDRKLLNATKWLGEATKSDTNDAKFTKISFALESLMGGESRDERLIARGIAAALAERAAFVAGTSRSRRLELDHDIRKHYQKRNDIVHGGSGDVTTPELDAFGKLVRQVAVALLDKISQFGDGFDSIEALDCWVKLQRYALPDEDPKEE